MHAQTNTHEELLGPLKSQLSTFLSAYDRVSGVCMCSHDVQGVPSLATLSPLSLRRAPQPMSRARRCCLQPSSCASVWWAPCSAPSAPTRWSRLIGCHCSCSCSAQGPWTDSPTQGLHCTASDCAPLVTESLNTCAPQQSHMSPILCVDLWLSSYHIIPPPPPLPPASCSPTVWTCCALYFTPSLPSSTGVLPRLERRGRKLTQCVSRNSSQN